VTDQIVFGIFQNFEGIDNMKSSPETQDLFPPHHDHGPTCGCKTERGAPIFVKAPTASTAKALDYCEKNLPVFLEQLEKLVQIPSVSLSGFEPKNMGHSADAVAELFQNSGLENVEIIQFGNVHPYVYADWIHKPDAPTLLLYAHHDVQPPGEAKKWKSDPFGPKTSGGRLYGRGAADDKAGILAHSAAIMSMLKTSGELPVNVKLIIEGEEEIGSQNLGSFVKRYKDRLKADAMILTDCANIESGVPSLTTSLRGLVAIDVEVEALGHSVHSGLWGGILPDPVFALSKILSTLMNERGEILVAGLYDDVVPLTEQEKNSFEQINMESIARQATGLLPELNFTVPASQMAKNLWRMPHLSINAIQSGTRALVSNVVQDGAWARISLRIVPNMKPHHIAKLVEAHLRQHCPPGFRLKTEIESAGDWWSIDDPNAPVYKIAASAMSKGYGKETQFVGCGASIPFVQPLSTELGGIPAILVGVEDPFTNAHSENESLNLQDFRRTLLGQIHMLADFAKYQRV
jgi:cysteinylglycine-S-conjugate dipeptidase